MSAYFVAYAMLFVVGLGFGISPFFGDFRQLPRWMHIALHMAGACLFGGATFAVALNVAAPHLSPVTYRYLWAHELLVFGMGAGILLLLLFCGILTALAELHAAKKGHSALHQDRRDDA